MGIFFKNPQISYHINMSRKVTTLYAGDSFEGIGSYISVYNNMTLKTEGWEFPGNRTLDNPPTTCGDDGFICIDPEREIALFFILSLRKHVLLF